MNKKKKALKIKERGFVKNGYRMGKNSLSVTLHSSRNISSSKVCLFLDVKTEKIKALVHRSCTAASGASSASMLFFTH